MKPSVEWHRPPKTPLERITQRVSYVKTILLYIYESANTDTFVLAPSNDEHVNELLKRYQYSNITNRVTISKLLMAEGIVMRYVMCFSTSHAALMFLQ
jgi:hypothetical protein